MDTILGTKARMSQTFVEDNRVPVTVVHAGPCVVTQVGNWGDRVSVQLGLGEKKIKNITKPMQGHLKAAIKAGIGPRFLCEVRLKKTDLKVGDKVNLTDVLASGDIVTVTGISKGKGFAGGMKRWGFAGGPKTHGQSDRPRSPGSIGQGTTPGRVHKGKKMAGRMGSERVTLKNIKVISVDNEKNELVLSGPLPGSPGTLVIIRRTSPKQEAAAPETQTETVEAPETEEKEGEKNNG